MVSQPPEMNDGPRMSAVAALEALIGARRDDQIVVTNQGPARVWPKLHRHPLDLHYNPSTMGGAIPLALGLAMAQPNREVVVVSGDGSLLMSLGSLVTVAAAGRGAKNLSIVLMDNGLYEVTGRQATAAVDAGVDYALLARGAGIGVVQRFKDITSWRAATESLFSEPGPRLFWLRVGPTDGQYLSFPTPPMAEQLSALRAALR